MPEQQITLTLSARTQAAVDYEVAKLARSIENITQAAIDGRIDDADRDQRIAQAEQWCEKRVAWITGQPRPKRSRA